jgi:ClpP class serine protease
MDNFVICEESALLKEIENERIFLSSIANKKHEENISLFDYIAPQKNEDIGDPKFFRKNGNIAEIDVKGFLRNDSYWWSNTSYNKIINGIDEANQFSEIDEIHFIIDSPGGNVGIVDMVWRKIFNSQKPTKAMVRGTCCSGAYYIACACDKIISLSPTNLIGSIGVIVTGIDATKYYKDLGIKFVDIVSDNAPKKSLDVDTKEGREEIKKMVTAIESTFLDRVATGRRRDIEYVKANFGQGGVMVSLDSRNEKKSKGKKNMPSEIDALSVGMIDSVESKDGLINGDKNESEEYMTTEKNTPEASVHTLSKEEYEDYIKTKARLDLEAEMKKNAEVKAAQEAKEQEEKKSAEHKIVIKNVTSILASGLYPEKIRDLGMSVIDGKVSFDDFSSAVKAEDERIAKENLKNSQEEPNVESQNKEDAAVNGDEIKDEKTFAAARHLFVH